MVSLNGLGILIDFATFLFMMGLVFACLSRLVVVFD